MDPGVGGGGLGVMEWKPVFQGTYGPNMNAFWWVVVEVWTFEKPEHKTLMQRDADAEDRGNYNSSPCTSYRWANELTMPSKREREWSGTKSNREGIGIGRNGTTTIRVASSLPVPSQEVVKLTSTRG